MTTELNQPTAKAKEKHSTKPPLSQDPEALIDTIDSFRKSGAPGNHNANTTSSSSNGNSNGNGNAPSASSSTAFDPVDFLNHHYKTEASLITALPSLRSTLDKRITTLDESISSTIQKQSDLADLTLSDVTRAKHAVKHLHERVTTVQIKANQSEQAVQEITIEMKQLDFAKKHLSKTITALKRLHMLLHAVKQLRYAVRSSCNPPDYKNAANLVDAVQLLLGHFEGYMDSVEKMRLVKQDVERIRVNLNQGIIFAFRVAGFGGAKALEKKKRDDEKRKKKAKKGKAVSHKMDQSEEDGESKAAIPLPPASLNDACHVLDALGMSKRKEFMKVFCADHLEPYAQLFHPKNNTSSGGANLATPQKPSFKIILSNENKDEKENSALSNPNPASLDQIERRYAWYRRMLRELDEAFPSVFPKYWNMEYHMTRAFLSECAKHILLLFSSKDGSMKALHDRDCENVSVLLKALQKTMLFEKEMTAWLQREYGTDFDDGLSGKNEKVPAVGEDGEVLEFGPSGKAVAAGSAEGIRIKYERQMNDRKKREDSMNQQQDGNEDLDMAHFNRVNDAPVVVPPLIGVASSAFEKFMGPYIALEEENMDEQLKEAASNSTVDSRGELPVLTSSTNLFLYIKNSITRCTTLTKGKTLFLLYRAFQRTLRKYATVLASKYPSALYGPAAAIGGLSIAGLTAGSGSGIKDIYRIPKGDETNICYVIDTCEYCSETVEALQDLIVDKIEDKYKSKVDMSSEEEAFHDVTAKGIKVLVSGLVHRTDQAFKGMYNINWSALDVVGEESAYVRSMHNEVQPFVVKVKSLLPNSYFRNFCDQFAMIFTNAFYNTITRQKRISESGTQQLLLDVYNLKTLLLKLPVLEKVDASSPSRSPSNQVGSSIAPAMYTKLVTKQFQRIEILLKLVGTPAELLIDVFKVQWQGGSALDLQTVMTLKGMKRNDQASMLEKFGVDPMTAIKNTANFDIQSLHDKSSDVSAKINSDLIQMREKVERFRGAFR
jgi:hypothetical protein